MIDVFSLEILVALLVLGYLLGSVPYGLLLTRAAGFCSLRRRSYPSRCD